ncbi:Cof-type HAD-IIB family hydrolase [Mesoplasma lactucae]|uniref:HAD family hydrolase n=1 Tax=Mesoplasma lactucae ATCC 49193 TaxID=81460 RepID=A0A291IS79_9MOLU|nr:Cof-type HAD-IIB family hydrolase [Mesoplasma lactucae]ATG97604.1 HAD family hydrolase [Mesoplasma lactucae ATCC 49193]ATZ19935.1 HAD superfamily hydrolase [Mesoplasma lactucae ATCC 49193]MCL8217114.1 Sugar phosphatase YidA [Mesoplasma lactucae ATCC 49193]
MKYKKEALMFSDLDSTLLQDDGFFSPKTRETVKKVYDNGMMLIPITARSTADVIRQGKRLGLDKLGGIVGGNNGGQVYDFKNDVWIVNESLKPELVKWVFENTKNDGLKSHYFSDDTTYVTRRGNNSIYWAQMMGNDYVVVDDLSQINEKINHLTIILPKDTTDKEADDFYKDLSAKLKEFNADAHKYSNRVIEVSPKNVSKGYAVKKVLEYLQVEPEVTKTYAFGDGMNDLPMFDAVDVGVAVENAAFALKDVADDMTKSNTDDGVSDYVEHHILRQK